MGAARSAADDRDVHHPIFARLYGRCSPAMEKAGMAAHRQRLLEGLAGDIIEIGCGPGGNFLHYPPEVEQVVAIEPERHLRGLARQAAAERTDIEIKVSTGRAERLAAPDDRFDAAVVSLVLCSVEDQAATLSEIRRVLRPGGELRFLEHVVADTRGLRRLQRALDATIWPMFGGGCHVSRDTVAQIERAGFSIAEMERYRFPDTSIGTPTSPHVWGRATLSDAPQQQSSAPA